MFSLYKYFPCFLLISIRILIDVLSPAIAAHMLVFNSFIYQEISVLKEDLSSHISFTNNCIADLQTALEENSEAGKVMHFFKQ